MHINRPVEMDHFGFRIAQAKRHEDDCRSHVAACNLASQRLDSELARQSKSLLTGEDVNR